MKEELFKDADKKDETAKADAKKEQQSKRPENEDSTSSSDEDTAAGLSKEDIKEIKKLIQEQENEIEKLKDQTKQLKEKLVYQLAENDNTVKRYLKEIDNTKEFAISKFAKDLLDVRDNLERSTDFMKKLNIKEENDVERLKELFEEILKGNEMTNKVMDQTLKRYGVVEYNPKGEKFDPNIHDAVFMTQDPNYDNNIVSDVMQTGWKIGERVLRAAKVGVVKK